MDNGNLRLYDEFASWWPLVSAAEDYVQEAAFFIQILATHATTPIEKVLELGCGGGNNALHMKAHYEMTLTDRSPAMLAQSRRLNPECEHVIGDMRTIRLDRTFDAVFVHDAVMYMTNERDLRQAIETAAVHCRPAGLVLFVPDYVRETFAESCDWHGADDEGRALRYLEWTFDPQPADSRFTVAFSFIFREGAQDLRFEHEEHTFGLFARSEWLRFLEEAGFRAFSVVDSYGRDLFVGAKRG